MSLTSEQDRALKQLLRGIHHQQVQALAGLAGSGKTLVLQHLAAALPDFAVVAFCGKSADVLRRRGTDARTIHSTIYWTEETEVWVANPNHRDGGKWVTRPSWTLKEPDQLPYAGFLVDEASTVSKALYEDLLSFGLPIIFCGDHGQLEAIGEQVNLLTCPDVTLETLHRNAGPIAHFASHLRKGNPPSTFDGAGDQVRVLSSVPDYLLTQVDQVIVGFNKTRVAVNERTRQLLQLPKELAIGDRIIALRNDHCLGLYNGMQATVTQLYPGDTPLLDFTANGTKYKSIPYDPAQFNRESYEYRRGEVHPFTYAYCLTTHKALGSEFDTLLVHEQVADRWDARRWCYTAASRAKQKLYYKTNGWTKRSRVTVDKEFAACAAS